MGIRIINGRYYVYYTSNGKQYTRALPATSRAEAETMAKQIQELARLNRIRVKLKNHLSFLSETKNNKLIVSALLPQKKRLKISDVLPLVESRIDLGVSAQKIFKAFIKKIPPNLLYVDEITPELALTYLESEFSKKSFKTYNNNKMALNHIFKTVLIESGLQDSPFSKIPPKKKTEIKSHRPFSEEELRKILSNCSSAWKTLVLISWYTGLARESCLRLSPEHIIYIDNREWISILRGKTKRFGRSVQIPLHPELKKYLDGIKKSGSVLPFYLQTGKEKNFNIRKFNEILNKSGVKSNQLGTADFHSLRASFISRCDAAGIPRHAVRSMVGHVSDNVTDVYSTDHKTPLLIDKI